jgi:uncharacterized protein (DUF1800 family)
MPAKAPVRRDAAPFVTAGATAHGAAPGDTVSITADAPPKEPPMTRPSPALPSPLRGKIGTRWRHAALAPLVLALLAACGGREEDAETTAEAGSLKQGSVATDGRASTRSSSTVDRRIDATPRQLAAPGNAGAALARGVTVRARGTLAGDVGPMMTVRIDGVAIGTVEVRSTEFQDYDFDVPVLVPGSRVDVVFGNDASINGQNRDLFVAYVQSGQTQLLPTATGSVFDRGIGAEAFDGFEDQLGKPDLTANGALRLTWPAADPGARASKEQFAAARFLQQATFGATRAQIDQVVAIGMPAWIDQQIALPYTPDFVNHIQAKYDLGADYRPGGSRYTTNWLIERFWATSATAPDQLRKRVAFALHQKLVVSLADSNQSGHARAYANYLDILNRHAFGNYRTLLEEISLSPSMGIFLSHIRNRKEDPATGRLPDENFARELMQLFSIGLQELNIDGSLKLGPNGQPIETYNNDDVMALAKVFTGWSWGLPNNQLTENNFRNANPDYSVSGDQKYDLQRMKAYPLQHSDAEKRLFAGKPGMVYIEAETPAPEALRKALDALFNHPNVGPFVARHMIQRLVTSDPSPAYIARVARAFNNNGAGVRGDMAAVVRAVLLDDEARTPRLQPGAGKLRDPVLRVTQWIRAMDATSVSGEFMMAGDLDAVSQRPLSPPSVFGYYRPGYVPPNTAFSARGATAPEFQLVNETTTAQWVNRAQGMAGSGLGWNGSVNDVRSLYTAQAELVATGNITALLDQLSLLLYAGRMSSELRQVVLDGVGGVNGVDAASHLNRARVAVFLALASPEYAAPR